MEEKIHNEETKELELQSFETAIADYEKQMQNGLVAYTIASSELQEVPRFIREIRNNTRFNKINSKELKC